MPLQRAEAREELGQAVTDPLHGGGGHGVETDTRPGRRRWVGVAVQLPPRAAGVGVRAVAHADVSWRARRLRVRW
ncbi:hypothetical protein GCM10009802_03530 [Streptomyces synnematoformans]|uniref:Uncharacterized protein n=1 Tax=Streptomyces synnematoformans TaxID=415721 RepID=A0ABN2XCV1_9ACTN